MVDQYIPSPVLDPRTDAEEIADAIYFTIQGVTAEQAARNEQIWREVGARIAAFGVNTDAAASELTDGRTGAAHNVLLTNMMLPVALTRQMLNQVPRKIRVELLRQLGIILQAEAASSTTLLFTKHPDFLNSEVVIPAGLEVADSSLLNIVATVEALTIASGIETGSVLARATESGAQYLPAGSITLALQPVAGILSISNTTALDGGAVAETVDAGIVRAREEMEVGQHLGSSRDYFTWLTNEVLRGAGRITTFEGLLSSFETAPSLGYLLIVAQGSDGLTPPDDVFDSITSVIETRRIAGISVATRAPDIVEFSLNIKVKITSGQSAETLIARAKQNLVDYYAPLTFPYGPDFTERSISFSDIIGQVERASPQGISVARIGGFDQITITIDDEDFAEDVALSIGQLPLLASLASVTMEAV